MLALIFLAIVLGPPASALWRAVFG
jgi:hypothetical protein